MSAEITENDYSIVKGLTDPEIAKLADCEGIIERGIKTFIKVGSALLTIRDQRLYREQHATFEGYCGQRWGFSRSRAHRLIEAAAVWEMLPIGNKPANEAQARPLAKLPAEERAGAFKAVTQRASDAGRKVTAKDVETEVASRLAGAEEVEVEVVDHDDETDDHSQTDPDGREIREHLLHTFEVAEAIKSLARDVSVPQKAA